MTFFIFWIFLSILIGVFASSKERSGVGWFFLSLIISPFITFIILLVAGSPQETLKKCPKCAEEVKTEAQVCHFCGYDFPTQKIDDLVRNLPQNSVDQLTLKKRWF